MQPPSELVCQIFSGLDEQYAESLLPGNKVSLSAIGSMKKFFWLRLVIIEDAVIMIDEYPDHIVFDHPVFKSQVFLDYAVTLKGVLAVQADLTETTLRESAPVLVNYMKQEFDQVGMKQATMLNKINEQAVVLSNLSKASHLASQPKRLQFNLSVNEVETNW